MGDGGIIKVLICDDQILFADNLKIMLETLADDIRVIGISYDGESVVESAYSLKPDIILMDVRMPGVDGVEAVKRIKQHIPNQKIIMLTTFVEDLYIQHALNEGVIGYIVKNIRPEELIDCIRLANKGSLFVSSQLISKFLNTCEKGSDNQDEGTERIRQVYESLGPRQKEILELMSKGYNNKKIAEALFISEPTVRNYISGIYAALGSNDRLEIITMAQKVI